MGLFTPGHRWHQHWSSQRVPRRCLFLSIQSISGGSTWHQVDKNWILAKFEQQSSEERHGFDCSSFCWTTITTWFLRGWLTNMDSVHIFIPGCSNSYLLVAGRLLIHCETLLGCLRPFSMLTNLFFNLPVHPKTNPAIAYVVGYKFLLFLVNLKIPYYRYIVVIHIYVYIYTYIHIHIYIYM